VLHSGATELSATLVANSKQLAQSEKEKKLYVEAVKMLKLRLSGAEAKAKDFAAKRGMFGESVVL
jgi:hypothetical protein